LCRVCTIRRYTGYLSFQIFHFFEGSMGGNPHLILFAFHCRYRYVCLLHDCECLHSCVRNRFGARDKGKNPQGDTMVVPLSSSIIKIRNGSLSFVASDSKNMVIHLQRFFSFFCHFRWRTLVHVIGVLGYCFAAQIT
jgi:hypothetical protein